MAEQRSSARRVRRNRSRAAGLRDDQRALDDDALRQWIRRPHRNEAERTGRAGDRGQSRQHQPQARAKQRGRVRRGFWILQSADPTCRVTYYNKRSTDVILPVPVSAAATGAATALVNGATITNKGLELALNVHPYTSHGVDVTLGGNYARNIGNVASLFQGVQFIPYNLEGFGGAVGSSTVGFAPGVIRGQDFVRCGRGRARLASRREGSRRRRLGVRRGREEGRALHRGRRQPAGRQSRRARDRRSESALDRGAQRSGPRRPPAVLDAVRHPSRRSGVGRHTRRARSFRHGGGNRRSQGHGHLRPERLGNEAVAGPGAGKVAFSTLSDWQNWYTTTGGSASDVQSQFVEDGSFVKWRELSLTYTVDQRWMQSRSGLSQRVDSRRRAQPAHLDEIQGARPRDEPRRRRVPDAGIRLLPESADTVVRRRGHAEPMTRANTNHAYHQNRGSARRHRAGDRLQ